MSSFTNQPVPIGESSLLLVSYHVIRDESEEAVRGLTVQRFRSQLEQLCHSFYFGTVADYLGWVQSGQAPHRLLCSLTFDDGLKGCIKYAAPLLLQMGVPATFYSCTRPLMEHKLLDIQRVNLLMGKLGTHGLTRAVADLERSMGELPAEDDPHDFGITNLYRYDDVETRRIKTKLNYGFRPPIRKCVLDAVFGEEIGEESSLVAETYMDESDIRYVSSHGFEVGCHFHDHEVMSRLSHDDQRTQTQKAVTYLSDLLGTHPRTAAYPFGLAGTFDPNTKKILTEEGMEGAVTAVRGMVVGPPLDLLEIPRYDVLDVFDSEDRIKIAFPNIAANPASGC